LDYVEQPEEEEEEVRCSGEGEEQALETIPLGESRFFFVTPAGTPFSIEHEDELAKKALTLPASLGYILSLVDPTTFSVTFFELQAPHP